MVDLPVGFYVSGLNLTEDAAYVLLHPLQSMRKMTTKALPLLLRWTGEQQPGPAGGGVNIVCGDFVGVSQFCSIVIGLNYKLLGGAHKCATGTDKRTPVPVPVPVLVPV